MSAHIQKEYRNLLSPWVISILLILAAGTFGDAYTLILSYFVGTIFIGVTSFGNEFAYRTDLTLMAQPVKRMKIWYLKVTTLGVTLMSVLATTIVIYYLFKSISESRDIFAIQFKSFIEDFQVLRLGNIFGFWRHIPNEYLTFFLGSGILIGFCTAPLFTLISRSSTAGFILSLTIPVIAFTGLSLISSEKLFSWWTPSMNMFLWGGFVLVYCLLGYCLGYKVFANYESTGNALTSRPIQLAEPFGISGRFFRMTTNPWMNLLKKEVRLHFSTLSFALVFWLLWSLAMIADSAGIGIHGLFFPATLAIYFLSVPLLLGACSMSEENQQGIYPWHLTLPSSAFKQWFIKVFTVFLLTTFLYLIPLIHLYYYITSSMYHWEVQEMIALIALAGAGVSAISILISSSSSTSIRAITSSFFINVMLLILFALSLEKIPKLISPVLMFFGYYDYEFAVRKNSLFGSNRQILGFALVYTLIWMSGALLISYINFRSLEKDKAAWMRRIFSRKTFAGSVRLSVCVLFLASLPFLFIFFQGKLKWNKYLQKRSQMGLPVSIADLTTPNIPDKQNFMKSSPLKQLMTKGTQENEQLHAKLRAQIKPQYSTNVEKNPYFLPRNQFLQPISLFLQAYGVSRERTIIREDPPEWILRAYIHDMLQMQNSAKIRELFPDPNALMESVKTEMTAVRQQSTLPYSIVGEELVKIPLQDSTFRTMVYLFMIEAIQNLKDGKATEALENIQVVDRFVEAMESNNSFFAFRERCYFNNLQIQIFGAGLQKHLWKKEELLTWKKLLSSSGSFLKHAQKSSETDPIVMVHVAQQLWSGEREFVSGISDQWFCLMKFHPWRYQNMIHYLEFSESQKFPSDEIINPVEFPTRQESLLNRLQHSGPEFFMVRSFSNSDLVWLVHSAARAQTRLNHAIIACALEEYFLDYGKYPMDLESLIPDYLGQLPGDVILGDPYKYRVEGSDDYILYAIGWDGLDHGGKQEQSNVHSVNDGDWIWNWTEARAK